MKVRKLSECGLREFKDFINNVRSGFHPNVPFFLLDDDNYSEAVAIDLGVQENIVFDSRFEMGVYLNKIFNNENLQHYIGDQGFWSWFALLWFDQLCPVIKGVRNSSKYYNYILSRNYNHRPRHSIYMTWQLVSRYQGDVKFMLSKPLSTRGEITEQMMARQEILSSEGAMKLASSLYTDTASGGFKKGSAARNAGCISRYISWIQQMQVTFDIFSITKEELEILLPSEFDKFRIA